MVDPAPSLSTRTLMVIENTARHVAVPAANLVVSYLVISAASPELWGHFAVDLVVVNLAVHLLAWGNKEYLLRAMSTGAESVATLWQSSVLTRWAAIVPVIIGFAVLGFDRDLLPWLGLWTIAAFFYQSFDPVVLYLRRFRLAVAAEGLGLAVTVAAVLNFGAGIDETGLVIAWVSGVVVRTTVLALGLRTDLGGPDRGRVDSRHLVETLPFALLSLSGLLASKVDLYAMTLLAETGDIGRYQVTAGLYLALQAAAAFVVMPFVRELYEQSDEVSHRAASRLTAAGLGVAALSVPVAWLILDGLYGFELGWPVFAIGAALVAPAYRAIPRIYLLFKHGLERRVIIVNLIGAAANLGLAVVLIPRWSVAGALGAAAVSQWVMLAILETSARKPRRCE